MSAVRTEVPMGPSVAVRVASLIGVGVLSGCSMFRDKPKARAPEPVRAVQAYNVTKVPEQDARYSLAYPTGDRRTSCLLLEQVSPGEVRVGREVGYQIKITNLTAGPVRGIVLRSRPLEGMR